MREGVALGFASVVGYSFVAAGETYWLEGQESDALGIIQRELDDASHLLVVDAVHDRHYRNDFDSSGVQVFDGLQLYVKQVANFSVSIGGVADAVKLEIGVAHAGFRSLLSKL